MLIPCEIFLYLHKLAHFYFSINLILLKSNIAIQYSLKIGAAAIKLVQSNLQLCDKIIQVMFIYIFCCCHFLYFTDVSYLQSCRASICQVLSPQVVPKVLSLASTLSQSETNPLPGTSSCAADSGNTNTICYWAIYHLVMSTH